jgi:hypothetical protein
VSTKSRAWSPERKAEASRRWQEKYGKNLSPSPEKVVNSQELDDAVQNMIQKVDPKSKDETQLSHYHAMSDPWQGAIIEDGWHYVKVSEHHQVTKGNRLKFLRMGYKIAPAMTPDILKDWDEARSWIMRIPQEVYDARVAESKRRSQEQRNSSMQASDSNVIVQKSEQKKTSLAELTNG